MITGAQRRADERTSSHEIRKLTTIFSIEIGLPIFHIKKTWYISYSKKAPNFIGSSIGQFGPKSKFFYGIFVILLNFKD